MHFSHIFRKDNGFFMLYLIFFVIKCTGRVLQANFGTPCIDIEWFLSEESIKRSLGVKIGFEFFCRVIIVGRADDI